MRRHSLTKTRHSPLALTLIPMVWLETKYEDCLWRRFVEALIESQNFFVHLVSIFLSFLPAWLKSWSTRQGALRGRGCSAALRCRGVQIVKMYSLHVPLPTDWLTEGGTSFATNTSTTRAFVCNRLRCTEWDRERERERERERATTHVYATVSAMAYVQVSLWARVCLRERIAWSYSVT